MADGSIRLGRRCFGIAAEIEDPAGSIWTLIEAMDGSRTAEEIVAVVARQHPGEAPELVRAAIADLIGSGYVEDCGEPDPAELTEREKERYGRCRSYFSFVDLVPRSSWWEPQLLLRNGRVTVVGLGGVGSHVALALAASGVGNLHCVDRDTVELSNLNRQILFTEHDIGRAKIEAGVDRLRQVNSDIQVTGQQAEITGVDDLAALAADRDVLVLCADHPHDITEWTNRACIATGTPWVDVGYHGPLTVTATYVPGQGPCWKCQRMAISEESILDGEPDRRADALVLGNAVMAPSAGIAGYFAANAVMGILTGGQHVVPGRHYAINLVAPDAPFVHDAKPRPDCPDCGNGDVLGDPAAQPGRRPAATGNRRA
jgi:molybdopterin-synthase adenylyltransferase